MNKLAKRLAKFSKGLLLKELGINLKLESGLTFPVTSLDNWNLINEIFVNNEYARPLDSIAGGAPNVAQVCFVDLGANNGMFSLYLVNRLRTAGFNGKIAGLLVEPASLCVAEIQSKLLPQLGASSGCELRIAHGLVGKRAGSAVLHLHAESLRNHLDCSDSPTFRTTIGTEKVDYVDLEKVAAWLPSIDIIKCDIEGSEFSVVANYANFLGKARNLVMEAHRDFGDLAGLQSSIMSCGFNRCQVIKDRPDTPIWWFSKV